MSGFIYSPARIRWGREAKSSHFSTSQCLQLGFWSWDLMAKAMSMKAPIVLVVSTLPVPSANQRGNVNSSGASPKQPILLVAYEDFHGLIATGLSN